MDPIFTLWLNKSDGGDTNMKILNILILLIFIISGCGSGDKESASDSTNTSISAKSQQTHKKESASEKYENAKKQNTKEAWEKLGTEALEKNDDKLFDLAIEGAWQFVKSDPKAMMGLAFLQIKSKEDYAKFVRSTFAKQKQEAIKEKQAEEQIQKQTIQIGTPINIGGIKILPRSLTIRKFKYTDYRFPKIEEETEPLLCLNVLIENITEGQVFSPIYSRLLKVSFYSDNFNNKHTYFYKNTYNIPNVHTFSIGDKIKPGEKLEACIPFEVPVVDNSEEFSMDLYLAKSNNTADNYVSSIDPDRTKAIIIKFKRDQIKNIETVQP